MVKFRERECLTYGHKHGYWYWIDLGVAELTAWGFMSERTLAGMRRHDIDPVQVEAGWADIQPVWFNSKEEPE